MRLQKSAPVTLLILLLQKLDPQLAEQLHEALFKK
jgi:hypothetical protein